MTPTNPKKSIVRFVRRYAIYNGGDVAGFTPEFAAKLVQAGIAVEHPSASTERHDEPEVSGDGPTQVAEAADPIADNADPEPHHRISPGEPAEAGEAVTATPDPDGSGRRTRPGR